MVHAKSIELLSSDVLEYEKNSNPDAARRRWVEVILNLTVVSVPFTDAIQQRGRELEKLGVKPIDALHAASAEAGKTSSLVTCDDRFAKRYRGPLQIVGPEKFVLDVI